MFYSLGTAKFNTRVHNNINIQAIECTWTIMPILILVTLLVPRLRLLYVIDEKSRKYVVLKCIGHQWYWSYERPFHESIDCYIDKERYNQYFDTDYSPVVPVSTPVCYATTSEDVLHSWTVPRLGIKIDAVPGRLNTNEVLAFTPGIYYGQCREICGVNHRFIPIRVEVLPFSSI
jgi:heme/copper-type cytochrome/quinol oxidase subunit 2